MFSVWLVTNMVFTSNLNNQITRLKVILKLVNLNLFFNVESNLFECCDILLLGHHD